MALTWTAKPSGATYRYTWSPALADGDSITSYTASVSGATLEASQAEDTDIVFYVAGGTAGTTATFTLSADTADGETLTETIYLPITVSTVALGYTAQDIISFALRKITGDGEDPTAEQADNALEMLNDMLALWQLSGIPTGSIYPLTLASSFQAPDGFVWAVKYGLRLLVHAHYGADISPVDASMAEEGKRALSNAVVNLSDVSMPATLANTTDTVVDLF